MYRWIMHREGTVFLSPSGGLADPKMYLETDEGSMHIRTKVLSTPNVMTVCSWYLYLFSEHNILGNLDLICLRMGPIWSWSRGSMIRQNETACEHCVLNFADKTVKLFIDVQVRYAVYNAVSLCSADHFKVTLVVSSMYLLMAKQLLVLPLTCKLSHDELNTMYKV